MTFRPIRAPWLALLGAFALAACSGEDTSPPGTSTSSGTGGAGGAGGASPTTTTSTSSGGGSAPIVCSGGYTNITQGTCDLLQQDCPPGFSCDAVLNLGGSWTTRCRGFTGLKGAGVPCIEQGECAAGLFCIGTTQSVCSPVCCPDSGEPCGGGQCIVTVVYQETPELWVRMCAFDPVCQLFQEGACQSGRECHVTDGAQGLATCVDPSDAQVDEDGTCAYLNDCRDMQHCEGDRCRYYCLLGGGAGLAPGQGGCPSGRTCQVRDFGISGVGLCLP